MIIKIQKVKQDYRLFLDNETQVMVTEDQLVKYRLLKGKDVTEKILQKIKKEGAKEVGLNLAYHYLSYGLKTEKEMQEYLKKKEIPLKDRIEIIQQLKNQDYLNDTFYGTSYIRTQRKLSYKGPKTLQQELKRKGLSEENIQIALKEYPMSDQLENSQKASELFLKSKKNLSYKMKKQKLQQHLLQKGFSLEVIQETVAALDFEENDSETITAFGKKALQKYQNIEGYERIRKIQGYLYRQGFSFEAIQSFLQQHLEE